MWCRFGWGGAGAGGPPPPLSPTQMGALCTLPTSKEQEANNITTPSARSLKQGKIDEMFKPEGRPPQQAESSTLPNNKEEDKEFGEQQEEEINNNQERRRRHQRRGKIQSGLDRYQLCPMLLKIQTSTQRHLVSSRVALRKGPA